MSRRDAVLTKHREAVRVWQAAVRRKVDAISTCGFRRARRLEIIGGPRAGWPAPQERRPDSPGCSGHGLAPCAPCSPACPLGL